MPRPKSKKELLELSNSNYKKLIDVVDLLSEKEKYSDFPPGTMNRNIRDVLAHLHHWHLMFLDWYSVGMKNEIPVMPAKGFSWKETPALNKIIWEKYNSVDYKKVRKMFDKSFSDIQTIINQHTEKELFEKKRYKWTGTTSLGQYLVSATSSHYDWALSLIKKSKKIQDW